MKFILRKEQTKKLFFSYFVATVKSDLENLISLFSSSSLVASINITVLLDDDGDDIQVITLLLFYELLYILYLLNPRISRMFYV